MVNTRPDPQPHLQPFPPPTTSPVMLNFWPVLWAMCLSSLGVTSLWGHRSGRVLESCLPVWVYKTHPEGSRQL